MLGYPIHKDVQDTLKKRSKRLSREKDSNPYLSKNKEVTEEIQKTYIKTPYITMYSSRWLSTDSGYQNWADDTEVILSNQDYTAKSSDLENKKYEDYKTPSGVEKKRLISADAPKGEGSSLAKGESFNKTSFGKDLYSPKTSENKKNYQPFRPDPGVTELTSEYESTTNVHFVRKVTISWKCWSLEDLNRLSERFLTLNKLVYVEWGWNYKNKPPFSLIGSPSGLRTIRNPKKLREEVLKSGKGEFDAVIGYINNFEWTTSEGGGFDCTTYITCNGVDILNQRINFDDEKRKKDKREDVARKYQISGKAGGEASITTTETTIQDRETFKHCMENLHHWINDRFDASYFTDESLIYEHRVYRDLYDEDRGYGFKATFKDRKDIKKEWNEVYEEEKAALLADGWRRGGKLRRAARAAANERTGGTRWEQYDEAQTQRKETKRTDKKERTRLGHQTKKYLLTDEKNFIQSVQVKSSRDFSLEHPTNLKLKRGKKTEYTSKQTWVRWGWFEDNILNKFFALVDSKGIETMTQIRSVKIKRDKNGAPIPAGLREDVGISGHGTGKYIDKHGRQQKLDKDAETKGKEDEFENEQIKIRNHPDFKTMDINSFLFPGNFNLRENLASDGNEGYRDLSNKEKERFQEWQQNMGGKTGQGGDYGTFRLLAELDKEENEVVNGVIELKGSETLLDDLEEVVNAKSLDKSGLDLQILKDNINLKQFKEKSKSFLFLKKLEEISNRLQGNGVGFTPTSFFGKEEYTGILRNVYINVNHLQTMLGEQTTLGTALNGLLGSFNSISPIFNLKPMISYDNDGYIIIDDMGFDSAYAPESDDIFEFPVWRNDSYVINQTLTSDITSEAQQILLGKRYAEMSPSELDQRKLTNIEAQITWDDLTSRKTDTDSVDPEILSDKPKEITGQPPFTLKRTVIKKTNEGSSYYGIGSMNIGTEEVHAKWGQKDGDYRYELAKNKGVDLGAFSPEVEEKIKKAKDELEEEATEGDTKHTIVFPGQYDMTGRLKSLPSEQTKEDIENEEEVVDPDGNTIVQAAYDDFGLIYLTNTIQLSGISGIYPSNIWFSSYLPEKFREHKDKAHFWTEGVSQTINTQGWTTELTGRVLFKFRQAGLNTEQIRQSYAENKK